MSNVFHFRATAAGPPPPEQPGFFLLRCLECDELAERPLTMPFGTARERGQWASAHSEATGVWDEPR